MTEDQRVWVRPEYEFNDGRFERLLDAKRETFEVPEGYEAVRDADGRATGEVRKVDPTTTAKLAGYSAEPDFAASIKRTCSEEVSNGAACGWMPCTGCYDTEDGHPTAHYRHSRVFGCDVGSGCSECGGLGVVFQYWSPEDLEDMQRDCVSETKTATQDELSYQCDACSVPGYPPNTKCECTSIQQDESCPVGYPSLLCEVCDGKGIIPTPAPHVACVQALLNSLDRTSIAKIVDPSAWINEGGYDIEQVHSGPALIAADQIITYVLREARSLATTEGSNNG